MRQVGKIVKIDGEYAEVLVAKTSMCGENCASCSGGCKPGSQKVSARFAAGVETEGTEGKMAVLEMEDKKVLLGAAAVYLLPLIGMFLVYFAAFYILKSELGSIILALISAFIIMFSAKMIDNRLKNSKKYEINIVKVLK